MCRGAVMMRRSKPPSRILAARQSVNKPFLCKSWDNDAIRKPTTWRCERSFTCQVINRPRHWRHDGACDGETLVRNWSDNIGANGSHLRSIAFTLPKQSIQQRCPRHVAFDTACLKKSARFLKARTASPNCNHSRYIRIFNMRMQA